LDVGASTGGFTDVLLARGARRVFAVDVGRGQLAEKLRKDPRVAALEETDARALSRDLVPDAVDLIVSDVSFIGLVKALPAALKLAGPRAALVALIKPQFESGPRKRETIDADEAKTIAEATAASLDGLEGFQRFGLIESPIEGGAGALEYLYAARRS
jgi:23S rRNA (cytidine1920-2'-O)/16S rRNA (cytidine1409-2'-O)-methyltransferase